jgi:hypothetical protein
MPGALGRVALVLLFLTCIPPNPKIIEGRYPAAVQPVYSPSPYDSLIQRLRRAIESSNDSLSHLASRIYPLEPGLKFSFSYAGTTDDRYLLLRYLAWIPKPNPSAGYSLQLLYKIDRQRLIKIFVQRIQLEEQ